MGSPADTDAQFEPAILKIQSMQRALAAQELIKRLNAEAMTSEANTPQAPSWQVAYHEVAIRSSNDTASKELGFKSKGTTVRGSREGDWLRLSDELGYMRIVDRDGTQLLVQQAPMPSITATSGAKSTLQTCLSRVSKLRASLHRVRA